MQVTTREWDVFKEQSAVEVNKERKSPDNGFASPVKSFASQTRGLVVKGGLEGELACPSICHPPNQAARQDDLWRGVLRCRGRRANEETDGNVPLAARGTGILATQTMSCPRESWRWIQGGKARREGLREKRRKPFRGPSLKGPLDSIRWAVRSRDNALSFPQTAPRVRPKPARFFGSVRSTSNGHQSWQANHVPETRRPQNEACLVDASWRRLVFFLRTEAPDSERAYVDLGELCLRWISTSSREFPLRKGFTVHAVAALSKSRGRGQTCAAGG